MDHGSHALGIMLHPIMVHFPIAFYVLEALLLALWVMKKNQEYHRFALFVFKLGYLGMLASMIAGYIDAGGWGEIVGPIRRHFYAALGVFVIYTGKAFYWKLGNQEKSFYKWTQLGLALVGNALIFLTGYLGGELVYGAE